MENVILDLHHSISRSVVLCEYLMSHPMQVVHDELSETYFVYDDYTKKFYYQKSGNREKSGVYVANGLMSIALAKGLFRNQEAKKKSVRDQINDLLYQDPESAYVFFAECCFSCIYCNDDELCECPCLEACPWY